MSTVKAVRAARPGRFRRVVRGVTRAAATATVLLVGTMAVAQATGLAQPAVASEPVGIAFTDAAGTVQQLPLFDVSEAYPGMRPQRSVIRLTNTGEVAQTFAVGADVRPAGSRSLDQVLRVEVVDRASGTILYSGRLSELSFEGRALDAGRSASYVVAVMWPETPQDDAYQGVSLSIELTATAFAA